VSSPSSELPAGPLNQIVRDWEYQGGWVRAPLMEIVFNNRLTRQARLLWLWLAAIHPNAQNISWSECEQMMGCGTKSRRSCLAQLVQEGFIAIDESGTVTVFDPYVVYKEMHADVIPRVLFEFNNYVDECDLAPQSIEKDPITTVVKEEKPQEEKSEKDRLKKLAIAADIISSWNSHKPDSYSKIRTLSNKQLEAVAKHMKNLGLKISDAARFIEFVCRGIPKSQFWSKTVDTSGRNFSALFGYGNPQDVKLRNVENLYTLGQEEPSQSVQVQNVSDDQKELIRIYRYVSFEQQKAINRGNISDMRKWQEHLDQVKEQMAEQNINIEDI